MRSSIFIAAALAGLALTATAQAADLYVSSLIGNDNQATSSLTQPFKTLSKAATLVNPGDTVWIMNGTYGPVALTRSGTSETMRITWKAYPGHTPELKSTAWNAIEVKASYQTIDGLILTGNNDNVTLAEAEADYAKTSASPLYNGNGITLDNRKLTPRAHYLTVRNCIVRKFGGGGIATIQADHTIIENNQVYENAWYSRYGNSGITLFPHNGSDAAGYRNIIRANLVWNNRGNVMWKAIGKYSDGNGVLIDVAAADYNGRTLISDNVVVNNGGSGIHTFKARRIDIVNNTGYMNGAKLGYPEIYAQDSVDVRLYNNIHYARPGGKVNTNLRNTNVVYDYNLYFNGTAAVTGPNDRVGDPLFQAPSLDPRNGGFALKGDSPAINSGAMIAGMVQPRDIINNPRNQRAGVDRGAYEAQLPAITSPASASAQVGAQFSYAITAQHSPTFFRAAGLPAGLSVDAVSGVISGIPTSAGQYQASISAGNRVGTYTTGLAIQVGNTAMMSGASRSMAAASSGGWSGFIAGAGRLQRASRIEQARFVQGSAGELGGSADSVIGMSTQVSGDVRITARVLPGTLGGGATLAGITLRAGSAGGAAHGSVLINSAGNARFVRRLLANGASSATGASGASGSVSWVRLERIGDELISLVSADGSRWSEVRRERVALPAQILAGLVVAQSDGSSAVQFSDVSIGLPGTGK